MSSLLDVRRRLLKANSDAWTGVKPLNNAKLDSSFRKNTAFVKKIKSSISHDQQISILKEIDTLTLEKYLSELIIGVTDGLTRVSKPEDIVAAMEIVLALHQRFTDQFTPALLTWMIGDIAYENYEQVDLTPEIARKQRNLLKLLGEFNFIGLFSTVKDLELKAELPLYITKNLTKLESVDIIVPVLNEAINKESIAKGRTLPIAISFLRRFCSIFLDSDPDHLEFIIKPDTINQLKKVYNIYIQAALTSYKDLSSKLQKLDRKIHKISIQTGKIPEELSELQVLMTKLQIDFKEACIYFSEVFKFEFQVDVQEIDVSEKVAVEIVAKPEDSLGCWDSIETKNFYTKLPMIEKQEIDQRNSVETGGEKIRDFIERLYNVGNRQEVDEVAISFISLNLLNKATNNRINKYFHETQEIAKLKFFSRFLATCSLYMPDVINDLVDYLDRGFRSQIYNNRLNFKNIVFFCELVKFKLVPPHVIFHKIRKLTLNISDTNNIDILGVVYEQCARFLLQEPEYSELMQEMATLLKERAKNSAVSINDKLAIKNMLAFTLPPPSVSIKSQEEEAPLHPEAQFIFFLIRKELSGTSSRVKKVTNLLLKANYLDPEARQAIVEVLSKPDKVNYQVIPNLVLVLKKMAKSYSFILPMVIDNLFEDIQVSLESSDFRLNRCSISQVRYLAEIYNYQLIPWKPLNLLLYRILNTGHEGNQPKPNDFSTESDLPNNYFRISLCTALLENINILNSMQMDTYQFMAYLEYYIFCKSQPLPLEIDFKINQVVQKLFPHGYTRAKNLRVALMALQEIVKNRQSEASNLKKDDLLKEKKAVTGQSDGKVEIKEIDAVHFVDDTKGTSIVSDSDSELEGDSDSEISDTDSGSEIESASELEVDSETDSDIDSDTDSESESEEDEDEGDDEDDEDNDDEDDDDEEDEEEVLSDSETEDQMDTNFTNEMDRRMEAEFDKEFLKIVLDSYEQNKIASHGKINISIPSRTLLDSVPSKPVVGTDNTAFKLLSKSGKKTNITQLLIPKSSKFNQDQEKRDEEQKTHRQRIIQLVENMENQK